MTTRAERKAYYREARRFTRYGWRRRHRYYVREHLPGGPATVTIGGVTFRTTITNATMTREVPPPMLFGRPDDVPGARQLSGTVTGYLRNGAGA